jgi:hypothetical protein
MSKITQSTYHFGFQYDTKLEHKSGLIGHPHLVLHVEIDLLIPFTLNSTLKYVIFDLVNYQIKKFNYQTVITIHVLV